MHTGTDQIRREVLGGPSFGDEVKKQQVYNALLDKTKKLLEEKDLIIVDATFSSKKRRESYYNLSADVVVIECLCEENNIMKRMEERARNPNISDVKRAQQYYDVKKGFDDFEEDVQLIKFDTCSKKVELKNIDVDKSPIVKKIIDVLTK